MLECEFVDRFGQQKYLVPLFFVLLNDRAVEDGGFAVSRKVKNSVLVFLHARDVLIE